MITEKDGIHFDLEKKIVSDSRRAVGDINIVSHAHFDHIHQGDGKVLCSEETAQLCAARTGKQIDYSTSHPEVELLSSGHVVGSTAALIKGEKKVLYTSDVSTRDRFYMEGFKPVDADILVVESTYGVPAFTLPSQQEVEKEILGWIESNNQPLILFGYSLGKAQKIQHLVQENTDRQLLVHEKISEVNRAMEKTTELEFDAVPYEGNEEVFEENGILVAPSGSKNSKLVEKLKNKFDVLTAGFSGWAVNGSMGYSRYDRAFPLSDHCGFQELVELVKDVDPEKVYTHHGFDEAFASYLRKELGYDARALKQNQSSLTDF